MYFITFSDTEVMPLSQVLMQYLRSKLTEEYWSSLPSGVKLSMKPYKGCFPGLKC